MGALIGLFCQSVSADATVSLTSDVSTVAEGGDVTFTVTVTPDTYVDRVILTYEGEVGSDIDTTSPYVIVHEFNDPMDDLTVTATVEYNNGDPDGVDTLDVDVVGLTITGGLTPLRALPTGYVAESNPTGKVIDQFDWTYKGALGWTNTYQDDDSDDDDKSVWNGKMVFDGTITCSATVSGVSVSRSETVTITPRSWPVPITCDTDNEPGWGDIPTDTASLGANRGRDTDGAGYFFEPRNGTSDFTPARTLSKVPFGPCKDWWYVANSILKCQRETVINKYIKSDGPELGGKNFYDVNNDNECFSSSSGAFVQAVENHEYRGTPDTFKSVEGHHGRTEKSILDDGYDAKQSIESLTHRSQFVLKIMVNNAIIADENEIDDYALDETYMETYGVNWGTDEGSLGTGQYSYWDINGPNWTYCDSGYDSF
jgi:hypothetical protein